MIDLCVLIWMRVYVCTEMDDAGPNALIEKDCWGDDQSLTQMLKVAFPTEVVSDSPTSMRPRWSMGMTALELEQYGYFKIMWTDRLQDHLLMRQGKVHIIYVFHLIMYLQAFNNASSNI
jgi:hypothetical protein